MINMFKLGYETALSADFEVQFVLRQLDSSRQS